MCPRETSVIILDFAEKLRMAADGDVSAYEQLCEPFADCLYTTAYMALKIQDDSFSAVLAAVEDGYEGVRGVKDELHLKAWLVRELTKNVVKKLKEYKAENIGVPSAPREFPELAGLSDIERLVLAISHAGKYNRHETALITGLSDELVGSKLECAEEKLGWAVSSVLARIEAFTAPEELHRRLAGSGGEDGGELALFSQENAKSDNELFSYFSGDERENISGSEDGGVFTPEDTEHYGDDEAVFTPENVEDSGESGPAAEREDIYVEEEGSP